MSTPVRTNPDPSPTTATHPRATVVLARVAGATIVGFAATFLVAGAVAPGYDPIREFISALAAKTNPHPWVMTIGFALLALGTMAAGLALRRRLVGRAARIAGGLVVLSGLGIVGAAAFRLDCSPTDGVCAAREVAGTVSGQHLLHDLVSLLSHLLLAAALFVLSRALHRSTDLRSLARPTLVVALAWTAYIVCLVVTDLGGVAGLLQRVFVVLAYGWPALVAVIATRRKAPVPR